IAPGLATRREVPEGRSERVHPVRQVQCPSQRREKRKRLAPCGGKVSTHLLAFAVRGQPPEPQEGTDLFERYPADQVLDLVPADDELTAFTVDVAELRVGDDNAVQTAARTRHAYLQPCLHGVMRSSQSLYRESSSASERSHCVR